MPDVTEETKKIIQSQKHWHEDLSTFFKLFLSETNNHERHTNI